ncbi:YkyA family protein [Salimicrobium halophilum]|uniref:Putative cell-wall binding lipoprotein n=1 Tax=Salimicrobium halophilum TaxID=86666 RepID=A0A1G8QKH7_9BACI|nr:YkyA family protein [Salimicrobium halophilum]SDJ04600.1 Putative cell-wall binding lipoprotein [Salimicrobium halophilum]
MLRKSIAFVFIGVLAVLVGCSGQSAKEEMYDHLEKTVTLEDAFKEQQSALSELEQEEQKLYNQIIDSSMNDLEKIQQLSDEALALVEERKEKLELENESIQSAKEEFSKVAPLIGDIEDNEEAQSVANDLVAAMEERYAAYEKMHSAYQEALKLDEELYTMLKQEDLEEETLRSQVESINEKYQQVIEINDTFNEKTESFNKLKKDFYEAADLNVSYE